MTKRVLLFTLFVFSSTSATAVEWSECEGGLSRVAGAAELSGKYISSMRMLEADLASLKIEYDNCVKNPDNYADDSCQDQKHEYEETRDRYETDSSDFKNELENLNEGVKSVLETCH